MPDVEGLRPTKDIVRETLFNWLQPVLPGSVCLDAFAGSGALGFEAASRDAARVLMLEQSRLLVDTLLQAKALYSAGQVEIRFADALSHLGSCNEVFDIIFLDPPFAGDFLAQACRVLVDGTCLHPGSRIYMEAARREGLPVLPEGWSWLREKRSGDVVYGLAVTANRNSS